MTMEDCEIVRDRIDYAFKNVSLLYQAFTRKSYAEENGGCDNEVLEFIGDKVLDFFVVKYLTETYGSYADEYDDYEEGDPNEFDCELSEGSLSEMKARLVQKHMLASRIDKLGFAEYLIMGKGDCENHVERQASVKEDLFEAILGAVALDSGWNKETLENVVDHMLDPEAELAQDDEGENYIGMVQDWASKIKKELPLYHPKPFSTEYMYNGNEYIYGDNLRIINWPVSNYRKRMCYLKLPGIEVIFLDAGPTDLEARKGAAKAAYEYLRDNKLLPTIRDQIENPNPEDSISQLEILARRGYFLLPEYEFQEIHDKDGNPIWKCKCKIEEVGETVSEENSSKKTVKKQAAYKMLMHVLEEG